MNCKPDDMAMVIRTSVGSVHIPDELLGAMVTVRTFEPMNGLSGWHIDPLPFTFTHDTVFSDLSGHMHFLEAGHKDRATWLPDCCLQPIRGQRRAVDTTITLDKPVTA